MEQNFDRYQGENTTYVSSDKDSFRRNRDSVYILRTRANKSRISTQIPVYDYRSGPDSANVSGPPYLMKRKDK